MTEFFTYKKINPDIMPVTLGNIYSEYPYPERLGIPYTYLAHYPLPVDLLSDEFVEILQIGGLGIKHAEVFFRPGQGADFNADIHSDGNKVVPSLAKINFVIGGENNIMKWYSVKDTDADKGLKITRAGTKYLEFTNDEVEIIDQVEMKGLYVVNAGIPHSVSMNTGNIKNPRICVSIVPKGLRNGSECSCNDVYVRLLFGMYKVGLTDGELFNKEYFRLNGVPYIEPT